MSDITSFKYFIDAVFYVRAIKNTPRQFLSDIGEPATIPTQDEWPLEFSTEFDLLFIEKCREDPNSQPITMDLDLVGDCGATLDQVATAIFKEKAEMLNHYMNNYGEEKPWNVMGEKIEYNADNLPNWMAY